MKSELTNNSRNQIELRRNQNTLMITGTGTIVFGLWSFVKALGIIFMQRGDFMTQIYDETLESMDGSMPVTPEAVFYVALAIVMFVLIADIAVRMFVGKAAISEGRGKRRGSMFIVLTCLLILGSIATLAVSVYAFCTQIKSLLAGNTGDISLMTIVIEFTSLVMMIEMLVSALRARRFSGRGRHAKG